MKIKPLKFLLLSIFVFCVAWLTLLFYMGRFEIGGTNIYKIKKDREQRLNDIWIVIQDYFDARGKYPTGDDELNSYCNCITELFQSPSWSGGKKYELQYRMLGLDDELLIIEDPGRVWLGNPQTPVVGPTGFYTDGRRGLFNSGSVRVYSTYDVDRAKDYTP